MKHAISLRWLLNLDQGHIRFTHNEYLDHYQGGESSAHLSV